LFNRSAAAPDSRGDQSESYIVAKTQLIRIFFRPTVLWRNPVTTVGWVIPEGNQKHSWYQTCSSPYDRESALQQNRKHLTFRVNHLLIKKDLQIIAFLTLKWRS